MVLFSQKRLTKKQKDIVTYIHQQREAGHKDGRIRTVMEVHGHTPENLNLYFQLADEQRQSNKAVQSLFSFVLIALVLGGLFVTAQQTGMTAAVTTILTGAAPWDSWSWSGFGYDCGDDYPADSDYVMDLSACVADEEETSDYLFCYVNNSVDTDDISPSGVNDDWYSTNVEEDISSISSIDTSALLESAFVFPWTISAEGYDNVDCFSWDHGATRTEAWHQCNASVETAAGSSTPPNLVFYYTDVGDGSNVSYGGLSTSLSMNSSYYLCYDELVCTTERDVCDEDAGSYCVGRLDSSAGSSWYPCDTTLDADYYRCCEGACDGIEMMCAGRLLNQEGTAYANFTSCVEDGTTGCCDDTTDCVYEGGCYNYLETSTINEIEMRCEAESHWCPDGFTYDEDYDWCEPEEEACYDSSDEAYCNSIFGTDDIDTWEADSGCTRDDPEAVYYTEACIPTTLEGIDYYFYQDITWY
ncbi:MAG: hypothetical protein AABX82_04755 [Nanoarchaeota archaeon]